MRILTNVSSLEPSGGVEVSVFESARASAARGHEITVVYERPGRLQSSYQAFAHEMIHVRALQVKRGQAVRGLMSVARSIWPARRAKYDVLYLNGLFHLEWGVAVSLLQDLPIVCHAHGMAGDLRQRSIRLLSRQISQWIAVSDFITAFLAGIGLDPARITRVYNGVDLDRFTLTSPLLRSQSRNDLGIDSDAFVLAYFGRVMGEKGVDTLLAAWDPIAVQSPRSILLLLGPVDPNFASRLRSWLAQAPSVRLIPMRADPEAVLCAANACVIPSILQDPSPRTVAESLAMGIPVIASDVGGIPELVPEELVDFLCPPGDVECLRASILRMKESDYLLNGRNEEYRAHVVEHFSLVRQVDEIERILLAATV